MIKISEILSTLKYNDVLINDDIFVDGFQTLDGDAENKVMFVKKYDESLINKINSKKKCMIILLKEYRNKVNDGNNYIFVDRPRYEFARVGNLIVNKMQSEVKYNQISNYIIAENSSVGEGTVIDPYVFIGSNVKIGSNCIIMTGAKIKDNVIIGDNCIIRENCVIGGYGFGLEKDNDGNNYRIPHIGGVIIENDVEIGALTTICSGTISPTIVKSYAKIDDHVHIAHNCVIGKNAIITACAEVSGSVVLGENCWLAPNTSIINGVSIGDNCTIGMGAVVNKSLGDNDLVVGPMAEPLEMARKFIKIKKRLIEEE